MKDANLRLAARRLNRAARHAEAISMHRTAADLAYLRGRLLSFKDRGEAELVRNAGFRLAKHAARMESEVPEEFRASEKEAKKTHAIRRLAHSATQVGLAIGSFVLYTRLRGVYEAMHHHQHDSLDGLKAAGAVLAGAMVISMVASALLFDWPFKKMREDAYALVRRAYETVGSILQRNSPDKKKEE